MSTLTKFSAIPYTGPAPTNREPYVAVDGPAADARGAAIAAALQHPGMTQEPGQDMPSFIVDKDNIVDVLRTLKESAELAFTMPLDLFGVDYPKRASGPFRRRLPALLVEEQRAHPPQGPRRRRRVDPDRHAGLQRSELVRARSVRHVRRRLRRPSEPAPHPHARSVSGPRAAQRLRSGAALDPHRERRGAHHSEDRSALRERRHRLRARHAEPRAVASGHARHAAHRRDARRRDDHRRRSGDRLPAPLLREDVGDAHVPAGHSVHRPAQLLLGHHQQRRLLHGRREAPRHRRSRARSTSA